MTAMAKEGRRTKDAEISENFNTKKRGVKLTAAEIRKAKFEQQRLLAEQKARERQVDKLERELAKVRGPRSEDESGEGKEVEEDAKVDVNEEEAARSAYQMLEDMRYVYRNAGGRAKLMKLMKADDKQFVFMVKELMKIEATLLATKIKTKGEGGKTDGAVFVVLKGLNDEKVDSLKIITVDGEKVNVGQIRDAMNPHFVPQVEGPSEEEKQGLEAPKTW
jgi:predicted RNase H-like nuclease (RuvC/YqgF family)